MLGLVILFLIYKVAKEYYMNKINSLSYCRKPLIRNIPDNLDGHQFEHYCADILRENGFRNVSVTKGSGDFGIDVLGEKDRWRYAFQCKYYSSKVGNHAVQEAYSGKDMYNADIAVVITNNYFSKSAIESAQKLNVELWDRDVLLEMINSKEIYEIEQYSDLEETEEDVWDYHEYETRNSEANVPTGDCENESYQQETPLTFENAVPLTSEKKEGENTMYDKEKGIFPSGEYIVGEDIPIGNYILIQQDENLKGSFQIYKDYISYAKDEYDSLVYKTFSKDYHIKLRTTGYLLIVEDAYIQKI